MLQRLFRKASWKRRGSRETKSGKYKVGVKGNLSRTRVEEIFNLLLFLEPSSCFHNTSNLSRNCEENADGYGLPRYGMQTRPVTPRPMFDPSYFSLGRRNWPIPRDDRLRDGHPITLCRNLVPMVDTPLSPPPHERGPTYDTRPTVYCDAHGYQLQRPDQSLESVTKHFQRMGLSGTNSLAGYSDCVICGKPVEQIKDEAVIDYLHKTAIPNESLQQFNASRKAFLEGKEIGTFLLLPEECRRLPPVMATCTRSTQVDNAPCRARWHYSETLKLLVIILKLLHLLFIIFCM